MNDHADLASEHNKGYCVYECGQHLVVPNYDYLGNPIPPATQEAMFAKFKAANHHYGMGVLVKRLYDNMLGKLGGPVAEVEPIASADYPTPAPRPANSQLDCSKLERTFGLRLPAWQEGVAECVERLVREAPSVLDDSLTGLLAFAHLRWCTNGRAICQSGP